jgi:hypothetical protein
MLACEAVDEAFEGLAALVGLLELIQHKGFFIPTTNMDDLEVELETVTKKLPTLIGLPVMLRTYVYSGLQDNEARSVASMLGMTEAEYRKNCLAGFNRSDECDEVVGQHVVHVLRTEHSSAVALMVAKWLETQIMEGT